MPESTPAEAVQKQQQKDATRLVERLEQVSVPDLTVSYTLEKSATVLTRPPRAFRCRGRLVPAELGQEVAVGSGAETAARSSAALAGNRGTGRFCREGYRRLDSAAGVHGYADLAGDRVPDALRRAATGRGRPADRWRSPAAWFEGFSEWAGLGSAVLADVCGPVDATLFGGGGRGVPVPGSTSCWGRSTFPRSSSDVGSTFPS